MYFPRSLKAVQMFFSSLTYGQDCFRNHCLLLQRITPFRNIHILSLYLNYFKTL